MNGFEGSSSAASSREQASALKRLQEKEEEDASGARLWGPASSSKQAAVQACTIRALCD